MSEPQPPLSPAEFGTAFRAFMSAMTTQAGGSPLLDRLRAHLGAEPASLPVIGEEFDSYEQPNLQVALDDYLAGPGRTAELTGIAFENKRFSAITLSDLVGRDGASRRLTEGPVDYINFRLAGDRVLACVQFGLYLVSEGEARLAVFVAGPTERMGPRVKLRLEVLGRAEAAQALLAQVTERMDRLNVYRGHVISLSPGSFGQGPQTLVVFHSLPAIAREDIVLPAGLLERVERHTVTFSEHAGRLLAAGRSLKRGMLLHGTPGTGKTLTILYLAGRMPGRTVILTTGRGLGMVEAVAQMARRLAPAMVVLEDVDLIAEERGQPFQRTGPLLFELLNEMDGLRDDRDVIFALTTNRADLLEPALAARPGRIDLAVELPLPDAESRARLLRLYARGLELAGDVDWAVYVERTDGASPAYIKELLRRATLLALESGAETVAAAHLDAALDELAAGGRLAERLLGLRPEPPGPGQPGQPPGLPPGFPTGFPVPGGWISRRG